MRIFPILLGAGAAAVLGVTAFASEAHPSNHGAAVSKVASQNRANDSDKEEVVAKATPKPAITPNVPTACAAAIAQVKALRAADVAEDAKEQAARTADQAEDQAEMTALTNAIKAAWTACRTTVTTRTNLCNEAREALARFSLWDANRNLQLPTTLTARMQQAIAQACA